MIKKIRFNTKSLGSEPNEPDVSELAGFIRTHGPYEGDLITFKLLNSLYAQKEAHISAPCAGGFFYLPRIQSALPIGSINREPDTADLISDANNLVMVGGISILTALPAPHVCADTQMIRDDEWFADYCTAFSAIMRSMRDVHIKGHILHATRITQIELELLVSRRVQVCTPDGSRSEQEKILESQPYLILANSRVHLLGDLMDQYTIRSLTLVDADREGLKQAMECLEPEKISVAGYAKGCEEPYWHQIKKESEIPIPRD